mgnify:CR=1 FL=1
MRDVSSDIKIKIYQEDLVFGPGLVILMEHILVTESMKDACGEMGMSYSKGWKIINRAEKELGYELLERRHGGKSGGKMYGDRKRKVPDEALSPDGKRNKGLPAEEL